MDDAATSTSSGGSRTWSSAAARTSIPREVEEFLYAHPAIEDVQVIGVPDEKYGEELCAWVKLRPGGELTGDEMQGVLHRARSRTTRCRATSASPSEFPMTVTGKVQKFKMRETSISELGLEAASQTRTA